MFQAAHPRITMPGASEPPKPGDNGKAQGKTAEPPKPASGDGKIGQTPKGNGQKAEKPSAAASNPATSDGRDAKGRFAKGNTEGFGNPFARQVGDARKVVLDCATDEELRAVTQAMLDKAKKGDVPAARLIYEYTIGKPGQAVEPDRLAREEMEFFKDASRMFAEAVAIAEGVEPWLPLMILRTAWPPISKKVCEMLEHGLRAGLPGHELPASQPVTAANGANSAKAPPVTDAYGSHRSSDAGTPQPVTGANGGRNAGSTQGAPPVTVANGGHGPTGGGKPQPVTGANGGRNAGSTQGAPPVTDANGGQAPIGGGKPQPVTGANGAKAAPVTAANGGKPLANGKLATVGG